MIEERTVSLIVVGMITATIFVSGPFIPVNLTTHQGSCESGIAASEGNATIQPVSPPKSATLTQSKFGADVWRLNVPDVTVEATDVQGCVRLTYEMTSNTLGITTLSTITLGDESAERLSIPKTTLDPDQVSEDQYDGELRVIYHGVENGTPVERTVVSQNITVEVTA